MIPTKPKIPREQDHYDETLHQDLYKELTFLRGILNSQGVQSYTPTLTNTANLTASAAYLTYYARIGGLVVVFGTVDVTPTTTLTLSTMGMSLPVPSNLSSIAQLAGAMGSPTSERAGRIYADTTNKRAQFDWLGFNSNHTNSFIFAYLVI